MLNLYVSNLMFFKRFYYFCYLRILKCYFLFYVHRIYCKAKNNLWELNPWTILLGTFIFWVFFLLNFLRGFFFSSTDFIYIIISLVIY